jgi:hypothetical protein
MNRKFINDHSNIFITYQQHIIDKLNYKYTKIFKSMSTKIAHQDVHPLSIWIHNFDYNSINHGNGQVSHGGSYTRYNFTGLMDVYIP